MESGSPGLPAMKASVHLMRAALTGDAVRDALEDEQWEQKALWYISLGRWMALGVILGVLLVRILDVTPSLR
jgi:hypothetical protein